MFNLFYKTDIPKSEPVNNVNHSGITFLIMNFRALSETNDKGTYFRICTVYVLGNNNIKSQGERIFVDGEP